jgi:hypothetical protein
MRRRIVTGCIHALVLTGLFASNASAQLPGSPFNIDGVVNDDENSGVPGGFTVPPCDGPSPQACKQNDIFGNLKELGPKNSNTTKIGVVHNAALPMLDTTNPNGQVDLTKGWTQSSLAGNGHIYFYFAWDRDNNSGSGFLSIEIQKAQLNPNCAYETSTAQQLIANCNPFSGRSAGDFILFWDQQGGTSKEVYIRTFQQVGQSLVLGAPVNLTAAGFADAEFCASGFCGEGAVDLTAAGVFGTDGTKCLSFANIIPGTVTGNSDTADYKDVILAPFPPISNCGTITVRKVTVAPNGTTVLSPDPTDTTFNYTINRSNSDAIRFAGDAPNHPDDGPNPQLQIARGIKEGAANLQTHTDLIAGTNYRLVEADPANDPYTWLSTVCTLTGGTSVNLNNTTSTAFPVEVNKTTACVITNKLLIRNPSFSSVQTVRLYDSITLSNLFGGAPNAATSINVRLFSTPNCAAGTQVGATINVPLSYSNNGTQADASTLSAAVQISVGTNGTFYWAFEYAGDLFNTGVTAAQSCGFESVQVSFVPVQ